MNTVFLTDYGFQRGTGHYVRCMNLASALQGKKTFFIRSSNRVSSIYPIHLIKRNAEFLSAVLRMKPNAVVIDTYDIREQEIEQIRAMPFQKVIVYFDDIELISNADITVNGNVYARGNAYRSRVKLLGPKYLSMDKRYSLLHQKKKQRKGGMKILVSVGGSDFQGMTVRIIDALKKINYPFVAQIVIGPLFQIKKEVLKTVAKDKRFSFVEGKKDLSTLIYQADLGITSGGITSYEFLCAGTPLLVFSYVDNQRKVASTLGIMGAAVNLGHLPKKDAITKEVQSLMRDSKKRQAMSRKGKLIVDGKGISRIANAITNMVKEK